MFLIVDVAWLGSDLLTDQSVLFLSLRSTGVSTYT